MRLLDKVFCRRHCVGSGLGWNFLWKEKTKVPKYGGLFLCKLLYDYFYSNCIPMRRGYESSIWKLSQKLQAIHDWGTILLLCKFVLHFFEPPKNGPPPPSFVITFCTAMWEHSVCNVSENCHFLNHLPTPMPLRNN